jgi:hypothetical protein
MEGRVASKTRENTGSAAVEKPDRFFPEYAFSGQNDRFFLCSGVPIDLKK